MVIGIDVAEQHRGSVNGTDYNVDFAVIEEIAKRRAAAWNGYGEACPVYRGHVLELSSLALPGGHVMEEQRPFSPARSPLMLIDLRVNVAVDHEQVEPTVVVVVEEPVAPSDKRNGRLRNTGLVTHIGKVGIAIVMEQHLVVVAEIGDEKIEQAVVLVVADGNSHRRYLAAIGIQREA